MQVSTLIGCAMVLSLASAGRCEMQLLGVGAQMEGEKVAVLVHVARVAKGAPLNLERMRRAAEAGIQGLGARSKGEVPVPGVQSTGWGYNFKAEGGAVQAIRCAAFAVPEGDRELHVRVQAAFQGAKVAVLKGALPGLLASLKFAATAPEDADLARLVERERCLEDQRVLTSAVRRFAEQKKERVTRFDGPRLVRERFVKAVPAEPWVLTPDGDVACTKHADAIAVRSRRSTTRSTARSQATRRGACAGRWSAI